MKRIIVNPDICGGKPVFEGTRIAVQSVLEFLAAGDSVGDIVTCYPSLNEQDIREALRFSSRLLEHEFSVRAIA